MILEQYCANKDNLKA